MAHKQPGKESGTHPLFVIDKTPSGSVVDDESIEKALEDAVFGPTRTPFAGDDQDDRVASSHDSSESDSDAECGEKEEVEEKKGEPAKLRRARTSGSWRKRRPVWEDEDDLEVT